MIEQTRKLVEWLNGLPNIRNAVPVKFTIGTKKPQVFFGARYEAVSHYMPTERHVTDGGKKAGDEYTEVRFYLLGNRPKTRRANTAYQQGDGFDWFVAGWWAGDKLGRFKEYHPFGPYFGIHKWNHELPWMHRIDTYEPHTYDRQPFVVELL